MKRYFTFILVATWFALFNISTVQGQAPAWEWQKCFGGDSSDNASHMKADAAGNIYLAGNFGSTSITFGSTTFTQTSGSSNSFFVRCNPSGNVVWAKLIGSIDMDGVSSLAVDANGYVYVAGAFFGSKITLGSITLTKSASTVNLFIAKFDSLGNAVWAKRADGSDGYIIGMTTDASGNVYVTGYFRSFMNFGSYGLGKTGFDNDVFLAKYNSSGVEQWAKQYGNTSTSEQARSVACDASGNVYLTGDFLGSPALFDMISINNNGGNDGFFVKINSSGVVVSAESVGGIYADIGTKVVGDVFGNVYLVGNASSPSITFDTINLTISHGGYFVKFDATGKALWAKDFMPSSVAPDVYGNVYALGNFSTATVAFDTVTLTSKGVKDVYLVKYNSAGDVLWAKSAGGIYDDAGNSVSTDFPGNAYIIGYFSSPDMFFGANWISNGGWNNDIFLARVGNAVTDIDETIVQNDLLTLYPNPSNGLINLKVNNVDKEDLSVEVLMINGQLVYKEVFESNDIKQLDLTNYPKGIYFVKAQTDDVVKVNKFVIQ